MLTDHDRIRSYYASFDEWARLDNPEGKLEFQRSCEILKSHLLPESNILDLGGGPGRYAVEMAKWGHQIVLADISPELLGTAQKRIAENEVESNIESIDEVNAVDLRRYNTEQFDAVVAFGPFYHLISRDERVIAAAEIARILKPGGLGFIAYIPRLSGIIGLINRAIARPDQVTAPVLKLAFDSGIFQNATDDGFQEGYYPEPEEMVDLFASSGLSIEKTLSLRSILAGFNDAVLNLGEEVLDEITLISNSFSTRPDVISNSSHAIMVVSKPN